jgi:hypothetical protein
MKKRPSTPLKEEPPVERRHLAGTMGNSLDFLNNLAGGWSGRRCPVSAGLILIQCPLDKIYKQGKIYL